jgi:hypothetical protein
LPSGRTHPIDPRSPLVCERRGAQGRSRNSPPRSGCRERECP